MKEIYSLASFLLFSLNMLAQCPEKTEVEWKEYFAAHINELDPIEGVWSMNAHVKTEWFVKGGPPNEDRQYPATNEIIIKIGDNFLICGFNSKTDRTRDLNFNYVRDGRHSTHVKRKMFKRTSSAETYLYHEETILDGEKDEFEIEATLKDNVLTYSFQQESTDGDGKLIDRADKSYSALRVYPTWSDINSTKGSGTGFALASNGYIVTNNHVINGAKSITVKGINGNFQKEYNAKLVATDRNNDIAIIQIDDPTFNSLGVIPYIISNKTSDVGNSVFVLGYPLRAKMGDEIKLTNGIISSKSGYQGDVTTYQISAPVQPGNSGGPMFDNNGNLIGIINAKLNGAENASYAIKTSYLLNLLETLPTMPKLQTANALDKKQLSDQVKIVKNFTYIIEIK